MTLSYKTSKLEKGRTDVFMFTRMQSECFNPVQFGPFVALVGFFVCLFVCLFVCFVFLYSFKLLF